VTRQFFGTDGIRDVAGVGRLAPDQVAAYGQALGVWLRRTGSGSRVLVGRDTRESGPRLLDQLSPGFLSAGHELVDGGVLPTPAVQTLCHKEHFALAVVISASHNPAGDNGLKFFGSDGRKLPDDAEDAVEALTMAVLQGTLEPPSGVRTAVRSEDPDAGDRYLAALLGRFPGLDLSGRTIVLDCANGAASSLGPRAFERLGATVRVRGAAPDGQNINAGAGVFHVENLGPEVRESGAVLGLALDGDADRVLLVDDTGGVCDGDHMLGILAAAYAQAGLLKERRLVTTVMANLGLMVFLKEQGIACEVTPVGDRFVAARMEETGAVLGGEQSGHIIFREDDHWYGDGLHTAMRVLEVVSRDGRPLSELVAGIEKYPQVLVNVPVGEQPPLEEIGELLQARMVAEEDLGVEGRVLLRYSGTEPLLRVMVEGKDIHRVRYHAENLVAAVRSSLSAS